MIFHLVIDYNRQKYILLNCFHVFELGIYLLDIISPYFMFSQYKIKVENSSSPIPIRLYICIILLCLNFTSLNFCSVIEYKYPGAMKMPSSHPIRAQALYPIRYFQQRQPFSIVGLIMGNPMMALMVVMFGLVMLNPKMMQGDKEQMKVRYDILMFTYFVHDNTNS